MRKTLGAILAAGFVYRLVFLGGGQLCTDELLQAIAVRGDSTHAVLVRLRASSILSTPLNVAVQKLLTSVFGESAWALRLPSVIFATLALWVIFRIASRMFHDRVALYSAALLALIPLNYHWSQQGQAHALYFLLSLTSYDLLLSISSGRESGVRGWVKLTGVLTLLFYSNYLALSIVISHILCLLFAPVLTKGASAGAGASTVGERSSAGKRRLVAVYLACTCAAFVLFLPWARISWPAWTSAPWPHMPTLRILAGLLQGFGDNSYAATVLLLAASCTGVAALRLHGRRHELRWIFIWLCSLTPAVFLTDLLAKSGVSAVHFQPVLAPLILLAGYGLSYTGERLTILRELPLQLSAPAIAYMGLTAGLSVYIAQSHWRRVEVDWEGAARYAREVLRAGDELTAPIGVSFLDYYVPVGEYKKGHLNSAQTGERDVRRLVVCVEGLRPDPYRPFKAAIAGDRSWERLELPGLTLFLRRE